MGELDTQAYVVTAFWDVDASVWVASSKDVPGLVTEADTMELLVARLKVLIPDLLEANGILPKACDSVPFHLHTEMHDIATIRPH
jgi:predicted RNase H-like HicB family nuclease